MTKKIWWTKVSKSGKWMVRGSLGSRRVVLVQRPEA